MLFAVLGSVGAIAAAATFLMLRKETQMALIPCLVSYAAGTLLTAALLGLLPQAIEHLPVPTTILSTVLVGIIFFFVLEKLVVWRHCHNKDCPAHGAAGPVILIGDAFHNFIDGIVVAASFLSSISVGIIAGISIIAHEIPQELGDFAILLHSGYSTKKASIYNCVSSSTTLAGALLGYYALKTIHAALPYVIAISASSFLYIALTDLYPELHREARFSYTLRQFIMMLAGIGTILLLIRFHTH